MSTTFELFKSILIVFTIDFIDFVFNKTNIIKGIATNHWLIEKDTIMAMTNGISRRMGKLSIITALKEIGRWSSLRPQKVHITV